MKIRDYHYQKEPFMPTGVYHRSPSMMKKIRINLNKGRTPEVRKKVGVMLKAVWDDDGKRQQVSDYNRKRMQDKDVREKHLRGLKKNKKRNFSGGNGEESPPYALKIYKRLRKKGFVKEYIVKTKGHSAPFTNVPFHYKIDIALPEKKIAIEVDGKSHRPLERRKQDQKKTAVLESLGWIVMRAKHD